MPTSLFAMVKQSAVAVGVDGSMASQHAFEWALQEAKLRRLPLVVLSGSGNFADLSLAHDPSGAGVSFLGESEAAYEAAAKLVDSLCASASIDAVAVEKLVVRGEWFAALSAITVSLVVVGRSDEGHLHHDHALLSRIHAETSAPIVVVSEKRTKQNFLPVTKAKPGDAWVLDLDGVVWLAGEPIEGAGEAISLLRKNGVRVFFATNNSAPTIATISQRLSRAGVQVHDDDLISASQAASALVAEGESVFMVGGDGLREALCARNIEIVEDESADVVVVGWDTAFTFERLGQAATLVRNGARFIGTNDDPSHPTPTGLLPGAGAVIGAVAIASGIAPTFAGKPYAPMAELVRQRVGTVASVIGDRASTDGALAQALGAGFGLVLSGVTAPDQVEEGISSVFSDLATLVRAHLD